MTPLLLAGLGGALGSGIRYVVAQRYDAADPGLPWGTILVNWLGSMVIGVVSGAAPVPGSTSTLLAVGVCGGLTTYSAFAVQTVDGGWLRGPLNVALTVPPALALCALGFWLARGG